MTKTACVKLKGLSLHSLHIMPALLHCISLLKLLQLLVAQEINPDFRCWFPKATITTNQPLILTDQGKLYLGSGFEYSLVSTCHKYIDLITPTNTNFTTSLFTFVPSFYSPLRIASVRTHDGDDPSCHSLQVIYIQGQEELSPWLLNKENMRYLEVVGKGQF